MDKHQDMQLTMSVQDTEELDYFLAELDHIQQLISVSLMTRRLDNHQDDPMEELLEVYQDVKEIEANLQKTINIASKYGYD